MLPRNTQLLFTRSKWDIVFGWPFGLTSRTFGFGAKELHALGNYLGAITARSAIAVFVVAGMQTALDIDLPPLLQITAAAFGELAVDHDVVPLDPLLPVAVFAGEALVGRH